MATQPQIVLFFCTYVWSDSHSCSLHPPIISTFEDCTFLKGPDGHVETQRLDKRRVPSFTCFTAVYLVVSQDSIGEVVTFATLKNMDVSEDNASAYIPSTLCHLCATYHEANNFTFPVINAPFADTDRELTPDYLTDEFLGQTSALVAQNAPVSQAILTDLESLTSGNTITPIPITTEQSLAIPKSRKPKESTINAEMWKVAEADIRLLWQKEGRSRAYILRHLEEKHGLKAKYVSSNHSDLPEFSL